MTFKDYSKRLALNLSREFNDLGACINALAEGLEKRDSEIQQKYIEIIAVLIKTLEATNVYTKGHSERVSHYSGAMGYPDLEQIRLSAWLHDIGKIAIGGEILNKPGRLTVKAFDEIKKHPMVVYRILEVSDVFNATKEIVKCHHEEMDSVGFRLKIVENVQLTNDSKTKTVRNIDLFENDFLFKSMYCT